MKTKIQKKQELETGKKLLAESQALVFSDFAEVSTKDMNKLRSQLKEMGAKLIVIKKRLLGLLLKEKGIGVDMSQFKIPIATIFSKPDIETVSNPVFRFFSTLKVPEGKERDAWIKHIVGGYNLIENVFVDGKQMVIFGKLPTRDVALAQTLGMIAAPIRSFLYILKQKAAQSSEAPAQITPTETVATQQ